MIAWQYKWGDAVIASGEWPGLGDDADQSRTADLAMIGRIIAAAHEGFEAGRAYDMGARRLFDTDAEGVAYRDSWSIGATMRVDALYRTIQK